MAIPNCCGTCDKLGDCPTARVHIEADRFYSSHPCWVEPPPDAGPDLYDAGVEADRRMEAEEARETWERERRERGVR